MNIEELRKVIKGLTKQQLNEVIPNKALQMTDDEIATVSFTFWLVYMAEADLNDIIRSAWEQSSSGFSPEVGEMALKMLQEIIPGSKELNPNNLEYFSDKIKIIQGFTGESAITKILWKLKEIRNDLSHNRIKKLEYDGSSLYERSTKEKVLMDYFEAFETLDFKNTDFWKSLSEDEKQDIKKKFNELTLKKSN